MSKRSTQDSDDSRKKARSSSASDDCTQRLINDTEQQEAQVGIIEAVSLVNFMCHSCLNFAFGANVNFVIGRNGSGKSAVLTALVVGLGGKASVTSRGSNLKGFIKSGKQSTQVTVTLRNRGPDAYKPDDFGNVIIVERRINADGVGNYKIKGERGNVVSTKKDELVKILDQFNIQVDNPVSVLNQETSRNFLNSKSPRDKYLFFLKATRLEQIKEDYANSIEQKNNINNLLIDKRSVLQVLEKEVKEWRKKWQTHQCFEEQRKRIVELNGEFSWAVVLAKERDVCEKEAEVQSKTELLSKLEKRVEDIGKVETAKKEKLGTVQDQLREIKQKLSGITPQNSQAKLALEQQKKDTRTKKLELRKLMNEEKSAKDEEKSLQSHIEKLRQNEQSDLIAVEWEKRMNAIKALEERKTSASARLRTTEVHMEQMTGSIQQYKEDLFSLRQELTNLNRHADSLQINIRNMEGSRTNHFKRFGNYVPELLDQIESLYRNRQFRVKPKGPIGAYISLRDEEWALPVEACLGNVLFSFCCDNHADEKLLVSLIQRVIRDGKKPSIIVSPFRDAVYDVEKLRVRAPPHQSVLDVLIIDDPVIANCLIDQKNIECILLVAESKAARDLMIRQPPRNCNVAYTKMADRLHANPFRYYSSRKNRVNFLKGSVDDKIREFQTELAAVAEQKRRVSTQLDEKQGAFASNQQELRRLESTRESIRREITKLNADLNELQSVEDPEPIDASALEEDIVNQRQIQERIRAKIVEVEKVIGREEERALELERECADLRKEINKLLEVSEPLKAEMKSIDTDSQVVQQQYLKAGDRLREQQAIIRRSEDELRQLKDGLEDITRKAEKVSAMVATRRTPVAIESEIVQIKKQLQKAEELQGSKEDIVKRYLEAKNRYDEIRTIIKNYEMSYNKLNSVLNERKESYQHFRSQLTLRIRYLFMTSLAQRKYNGKMVFNHKKETLELSVQPHENVEEMNEDTRALSGGERSFSTVCFILALWDAMESPFRILDEFDVFMDMVNRRIAMDMMMETALHKQNTQFLFLTPQDMTRIRASRLVRICQMPDPVRERKLANNLPDEVRD